MTSFEVGAVSGIVVGSIAGGVVCKSFGILAIFGGVVSGGAVGYFLGLVYGAVIVMLCGTVAAFWQLITGQLKPLKNPEDDAKKKDHTA